MMVRSKLFLSNGLQAVRLRDDIAFPADVKEVAIWREGNRLVLAPADAGWSDFFDASVTILADRDQAPLPKRDSFDM